MSSYALRDENAIYFECDYGCDNAIFARINNESFFITDGRYEIEARESVKAELIISNELVKSLYELCKSKNVKEIVIDPKDWSLFDFLELEKLGLKTQYAKDFSKLKRIIKSPEERAKLKRASELGARCFDEFASFINSLTKPISTKELFFHTSNIFRQNGECELSFSPIVGVNANAAKSHALPDDTMLNRGDLLLLDAGVRLNNYCSDRTRTSCFTDDGWSSDKLNNNFLDSKQKEVYSVVLKAQLEAIKAAKIGMKASDLDLVARTIIKDSGFGEFFIHSLGHGVGLDIHELPNISSRSDFILEEGMVFTIEPGVYLANEFGIRIEDTIYLGKNGAEIL